MPVANIEAFLALGMMLSHDQSALDSEKIKLLIPLAHPLAMPMVHKYDAKGLLGLVHVLIHTSPTKEGVLAVMKYGDGSLGWMQNQLKDFALMAIFPTKVRLFSGQGCSFYSSDPNAEAEMPMCPRCRMAFWWV